MAKISETQLGLPGFSEDSFRVYEYLDHSGFPINLIDWLRSQTNSDFPIEEVCDDLKVEVLHPYLTVEQAERIIEMFETNLSNNPQYLPDLHSIYNEMLQIERQKPEQYWM